MSTSAAEKIHLHIHGREQALYLRWSSPSSLLDSALSQSEHLRQWLHSNAASPGSTAKFAWTDLRWPNRPTTASTNGARSTSSKTGAESEGPTCLRSSRDRREAQQGNAEKIHWEWRKSSTRRALFVLERNGQPLPYRPMEGTSSDCRRPDRPRHWLHRHLLAGTWHSASPSKPTARTSTCERRWTGQWITACRTSTSWPSPTTSCSHNWPTKD